MKNEIQIIPSLSLADVVGGVGPAWLAPLASAASGLFGGEVNAPVTTGQDNKVQSGGKGNKIK